MRAVGVDSPGTMRGAATTETDGRFHIDSLPPGRYMVGFESPLLDSLEIALAPRAATITAGGTATVALALPPATKLRASVTTDAGGWYVVCRVPTGMWVSMQIQHEGRVGPVIRTFVDDSLGIAICHLSFTTSVSRAEAKSGTVGGNTAGTVALSGTAALSGVVLGAADAPVASEGSPAEWSPYSPAMTAFLRSPHPGVQPHLVSR
jgi:hypothetical protein